MTRFTNQHICQIALDFSNLGIKDEKLFEVLRKHMETTDANVFSAQDSSLQNVATQELAKWSIDRNQKTI